MKTPIFALLVLLSLLSLAPAVAQTPPVAGQDPVTAPVPEAAADFLATLSDGQAQTSEDQMPAPLFMSGCASPCSSGEICCYMCGALPDGDDSFCWMCVTPQRGRCPIVA